MKIDNTGTVRSEIPAGGSTTPPSPAPSATPNPVPTTTFYALITWTPELAQIPANGEVVVEVIATDKSGAEARRKFTLKVNRPPVIPALDQQLLQLNETKTVELTAIDPEGQRVRFEMGRYFPATGNGNTDPTDNPVAPSFGWSIDLSAAGIITARAGCDAMARNVRKHSFWVTAIDSLGARSSREVAFLLVADGNRPDGPIQLIANYREAWTYDISEDYIPDCQRDNQSKLSFRAVNDIVAIDGLQLEPTGRISWTPNTVGPAGPWGYELTVEITDPLFNEKYFDRTFLRVNRRPISKYASGTVVTAGNGNPSVLKDVVEDSDGDRGFVVALAPNSPPLPAGLGVWFAKNFDNQYNMEALHTNDTPPGKYPIDLVFDDGVQPSRNKSAPPQPGKPDAGNHLKLVVEVRPSTATPPTIEVEPYPNEIRTGTPFSVMFWVRDSLNIPHLVSVEAVHACTGESITLLQHAAGQNVLFWTPKKPQTCAITLTAINHKGLKAAKVLTIKVK